MGQIYRELCVTFGIKRIIIFEIRIQSLCLLPPAGGGEGKSPIGRPSPVTPWGKPAMGYKTRKKNHRTDKQIARRRNGK